MLAESGGERAPWILCEVEPIFDVVPPGAFTISWELGRVVEAGHDYPPALAIARALIAGRLKDARDDRELFLTTYCELLQTLLSRQPADPYFLARTIRERAFLWLDTWHWLLSYDRKEERVLWVSGDYHVYADPARCFDVSPALLERIENADVYG